VGEARTAKHVQHDGGGVQVGGRARVVAGVLAPRRVDYQVAHLQHMPMTLSLHPNHHQPYTKSWII
jgi:hypothetical protein